MRKRKPKSIEAYIKEALRRIWGWDPERKRARNRARITSYPLELFKCEECHDHPLQRGQVEIDHMVPVEDVRGFDGDWNGFIGRLFCPAESLKILCKRCHSRKSVAENAVRRTHRKAKDEQTSS